MELFGRNVTNTFYQTGITYTVDTIVGIAGMPATYGVRLSYRY